MPAIIRHYKVLFIAQLYPWTPTLFISHSVFHKEKIKPLPLVYTLEDLKKQVCAKEVSAFAFQMNVHLCHQYSNKKTALLAL